MRRAIGVVALLLVLGTASGVTAGTGRHVIEPAYYEGEEVGLLVPSGSSHNPKQVIGGGGCFPLGPDMNATGREKAATLYALFVPGATQYGCPDGSRMHDHVIPVAPGDAGYSAAWRVVIATPGPGFVQADMPYTSEAEVLSGVAAGKLVLSDTGFTFLGPVVGIP